MKQTSISSTNVTQKNDSTVILSANENYDGAGKVTRMLLGEHYRKEWNTPVEVEVLDLKTKQGGLTPIKEGGGFQTKSLRLQSADGKEYVLRSINKDPSKAIPLELVNTLADDVVQDQISSSNPYAPLAVASLADAAKIYHTTPEVVFVEKNEALGQFNETFANSLCLFELRPTGDQHDNPAVGYSNEVVNSEKMFKKILGDNNHQMDAASLLNARLFDMWIGDWDRHEDQWVWATFKEGSQTIYRPIPRDRDQAFSRLDGVIPQIAARKWAVRKTQNFDETIRDVYGLNMNGIHLDREFLTSLTRDDWRAVSTTLKSRLTDEVIDASINKMPAAIRELSGDDIASKLKKRRDDLVKYSVAYYEFLAKDPDVVGSDKKEIFEVERNDESTIVNVYQSDSLGNKKNSIFHREFYNSETKEIRLYLLGGNDIVRFTQNSDNGILVRVVGGNGNDEYANTNKDQDLNNVRIYDSPADRPEEKIAAFSSVDTLRNSFIRKGYKYDWLAPMVVPGYNPDDGVYMGGGFVLRKQGFGKAPFASLQSVWMNHSFTTKAYNFGYKGMFREAVGKLDLVMGLDVNAPNYVLNYFGEGNETELVTDDHDYNRVRADKFVFTPGLQMWLSRDSRIVLRTEFQSVKVENSAGRYMSDQTIDTNVFERKNFVSVQASYNISKVDNEVSPKKGFIITATGGYNENMDTDAGSYGFASANLQLYHSFNNFTLVNRVGAGTNFSNNYEFYQSNTLGGGTNLRGYRNDRFAGRTSFYQNTELRYNLSDFNCYLFKSGVGVLAFTDMGRVWVDNEDSNQWHRGVGGGFWLTPFSKTVFTVTYATSQEENIFSIKGGFQF